MDRIEIRSLKGNSNWSDEKISDAYKNLIPYVDEYKYLASIKTWNSLRDKPEVYIKLQEAYDIMTGTDTKKYGMRCKPCERVALCAIKDIVLSEGNLISNIEDEQWEADSTVIEECEVKHQVRLKVVRDRIEAHKNSEFSQF